MLFEKKFNMILEGKTVQENYTFINPIDYSDVIILLLAGSEGRKKYYEFYKVVNNKNNNLKYINYQLFTKLPEEYIKGWEKKYLVNGRDIMYKYGMEEGEGFTVNSYYIVKHPKHWDKEDMFIAYLKPTNLTGDVKDVFGNMFTEL